MGGRPRAGPGALSWQSEISTHGLGPCGPKPETWQSKLMNAWFHQRPCPLWSPQGRSNRLSVHRDWNLALGQPRALGLSSFGKTHESWGSAFTNPRIVQFFKNWTILGFRFCHAAEDRRKKVSRAKQAWQDLKPRIVQFFKNWTILGFALGHPEDSLESGMRQGR